MATTKIWPIKDSLARVVEYARNPEKPDLHAVLHYAADDINMSWIPLRPTSMPPSSASATKRP